jgi:hypothetical protein
VKRLSQSPYHQLNFLEYASTAIFTGINNKNINYVKAAQARNAYPEKLAAIGKLIALEPYINSGTPILHRCLTHGELQHCRPGNALMGKGLRCCRKASARTHGLRFAADAAAVYDAKLARIGRLKRLEPYVNCKTSIMHRCLAHGKEYRTIPERALRGSGLNCCRGDFLSRGPKANGARSKAAAATAYDGKLSTIGKLKRLEPYAGADTPILHRCLKHKEDHKTRPSGALRGQGLKCCHLVSSRTTAERRKTKASDAYDPMLHQIGKLQRLEPYRDSKTPILHRCLEHGEKHKTTPGRAMKGGGLKCCQREGAKGSTLPSLIFTPGLYESSGPCHFYIYSIPSRPNLVKPGISNNFRRRASDGRSRGLYGDLVAVWDLPTRRDALLIEGAILRDQSIPAPSDLGDLALIDGFSEVRRISPDALASHAQALIDSLAAHDGPWQQWALDNVPTLYRAERIALRRQMA